MYVPFLSLKDVTAKYADEIHAAVDSVIDSGWYLHGEQNRIFERDFSNYVGADYCVGCANGLDALICILRAYKELGMLHDGDEVIVPANTYIATILAITENNLVPVLAEPRWETLEIDEDEVERLITPRTKAVMIVHLYGRNAYTPKIGELCRKNNLLLVADCAQAHGMKWGEMADYKASVSAQAWSFYPGKNLGALGDGGGVTTDNKALADVVRTLANYGSQKKYWFKYQGRNSRLDEIQAAVLSVKLKHLDEDNEHRRNIARYYYENIKNANISLPCINDVYTGVEECIADSVFHLFPILCADRDRLQQYLSDKGIETLIHYPIPPHKQECYKDWNDLSLPVTERIAEQELSIPIGPAMTMEETRYVAETLNSFQN